MQVYKTSNQVILLKLREMIFTDFTRDSIDKNNKSNEVTKHFHDASICATQSMKYQSFAYVPVLLQKYKKYSCALRNIDIKEDIWSKLILKDHQNSKPSRWTIFCQLKLLLKMHGARVTQEQKKAWSSCHTGTKTCSNSHTLEKFHFFIIKRCRAYT